MKWRIYAGALDRARFCGIIEASGDEAWNFAFDLACDMYEKNTMHSLEEILCETGDIDESLAIYALERELSIEYFVELD